MSMVPTTNTEEKVKENAHMNMTNSNNKKKALGIGIKALLNNIDEELKATADGLPAAPNRNNAAAVAPPVNAPVFSSPDASLSTPLTTSSTSGPPTSSGTAPSGTGGT